MSTKNIGIIVGILGVVGIALVVGMRNTDTPVDEVVTVQQNGDQAEEETSPEELSQRFPIYPNAQVESNRNTENDEAFGYSLSLLTSDSEDEIYAWYLDAFSSNGWSVTSNRVVGGYRIIQARAEGLYSTIQAASDGDLWRISQQVRIYK